MTGAPESAWADRPVAAARAGLLGLVGLAPVAVGLCALLAGSRGALGAALGLSVPALVLAITYVAVELGRRRSPQFFAGALLASYLIKLVAVGGLLVALRVVDDVSRNSLGLTAVLGLLLAVVVEAAVVVRSRLPYVEPDGS